MNTNETYQRDFKGIWIPKKLWLLKGLSWCAKILLLEIYSLYSEEHDGCYASNEYLMDFLGINRSRFYEVLAELKEKNLLTIVKDGNLTIKKVNLTHNLSFGLEEGYEQPNGSGKPDSRGPENRTQKGPHIIYSNKKESNSICPDPTKTSVATGLVLGFSIEKGFINISSQDKENWKIAYPYVNIDQELMKAQEWVKSNPSKAKKNWRKFITGWLGRQNEKLENRQAYASNKNPEPNTEESRKWASRMVSTLQKKLEKHNVEVHVGPNQVEFILSGCQSSPECVEYSDKHFEEKCKNILRKRGVV